MVLKNRETVKRLILLCPRYALRCTSDQSNDIDVLHIRGKCLLDITLPKFCGVVVESISVMFTLVALLG